eukprot:9558746-Prorocentrum_lima.AAC.1
MPHAGVAAYCPDACAPPGTSRAEGASPPDTPKLLQRRRLPGMRYQRLPLPPGQTCACRGSASTAAASASWTGRHL